MVEKEPIEIHLPKRIIAFLRAMELNLGMTVKEYLEYSLIQVVAADLDSGGTFSPDPETLKERFELGEILTD